MTTAQGIPTPRLRLIHRVAENSTLVVPVLQHQVYVTFDQGQTKERSRWVWMDVPTGEETADEKKARVEVEGIKGFLLATNQMVR